MGGFPVVSFHFLQWKMFFPVLKILEDGIPQSFMLSLKCDHPFLSEFSTLFSTVNLKLWLKFSQFTQRFKTWILKFWFWAAYFSKFFPIHKRDGNLDFWKAYPALSNFTISLKSLKIGIFEVPLPLYFVKWWGQSFSATCGVSEEPLYD